MTASIRPPQAVLIVEHDEQLKMLTADIVENAGFAVLQSSNADEALAILAARSDIALLFTSISMPGSMDGVKLAHAVRDRWPAIKILVVSGQVRLTGYNLPAGSSFFFKPYQSAAVISEIRSLIGA